MKGELGGNSPAGLGELGGDRSAGTAGMRLGDSCPFSIGGNLLQDSI